MDKKMISHEIVELLGEKYVAYIKEVPCRIGNGGVVEKTVVRAFIKKL
tara:strand:+ start:820 stop:963 length:144 start_codon:yes stop_codon:yes gene_type:complete